MLKTQPKNTSVLNSKRPEIWSSSHDVPAVSPGILRGVSGLTEFWSWPRIQNMLFLHLPEIIVWILRESDSVEIQVEIRICDWTLCAGITRIIMFQAEISAQWQ